MCDSGCALCLHVQQQRPRSCCALSATCCSSSSLHPADPSWLVVPWWGAPGPNSPGLDLPFFPEPPAAASAGKDWKGLERLGNMRGTWTDAEMCSTCCKHMFDMFVKGDNVWYAVFECPAVTWKTWNLPRRRTAFWMAQWTPSAEKGWYLRNLILLSRSWWESSLLLRPWGNRWKIAAGFLSMAALASSLNFQVFNRVRGLLMALQQGTSLMFWLQNCKDQYWRPILRVHQFCNLTALRPTCTTIFSFPLIAWFRDSGWLSIWGWGVKIPVTDQRVQYVVIK